MALKSKIRDFVEASFYRKLGKENLVAYLNSANHTHEEAAIKILNKVENGKEIESKVSEELQAFFQSDENPNSIHDLENFIKINDLAGERGNAKMHAFYKEIEELKKYISTAGKQKHSGHQLALNLFIHERESLMILKKWFVYK